jgi:hypothetical protein
MIQFDEILKKIPESKMIIPTLGGRSSFTIKKNENSRISIINSRGSKKIIDKEYWEKVAKRREELNVTKKNRTSFYTDPLWNIKEVKIDRIFPPYIAAIMKHYEDLEKKG